MSRKVAAIDQWTYSTKSLPIAAATTPWTGPRYQPDHFRMSVQLSSDNGSSRSPPTKGSYQISITAKLPRKSEVNAPPFPQLDSCSTSIPQPRGTGSEISKEITTTVRSPNRDHIF